MKTRMFATAFESGRDPSSAAHACGFVSRTTVRREGARSESFVRDEFGRKTSNGLDTDLSRRAHNARRHRRNSWC